MELLKSAVATARRRVEIDLVWRCRSCGYQRQGKTPPTSCSGCKGPETDFEGRTMSEWHQLVDAARAGVLNLGQYLAHGAD